MVTHLSYSSLTTWNRCKKSYELSRIKKAWPIPAVYFIGGTAVHQATEDYDSGKELKSWNEYVEPGARSALEMEPDIDVWMSGGTKPNDDTMDKWAEIGPECIENWKEFRKEFDVRHIELDVTTKLPGLDVPVKGFIDRIGTHKKHGDLIVDIKTGKNAPKDKGLQLGVYSALYERKTGIPMSKGAYWMAREGRLSKVYDLSEYTIASVTSMFKEVLDEVNESTRTNSFPPSKQFTCKFCDQRLNCYTVSGDTPRTEYYDSLHPEYTEEIPF